MDEKPVRAMDLPAAEYFRQEYEDSHGLVALEVVGPYALHLTFDDGKQATIDFEPAFRKIFTGPMYEPMLDPAYFARAYFDCNGILTWPNGMDINPAYIYDWPKWIEPLLEDESTATS